MNLQPSTAVPSIGETFGALYVGTTIAAVLFGITNLQTVIYYKRYPNDWWLYRYSVALLWVLDTLHVVLSTHALYFYLIEMFGDLSSALVHNIWSFKVQLVINLYTFQGYMPSDYGSVRILVVVDNSKLSIVLVGRHFHKILPWFVFLAMASSFGNSITPPVSTIVLIMCPFHSGAGIFIIYEISMTPNFSAISDIKTSIYAIFSTVAATDFSIALMMCYYLHKSRAMNISTTACRVLNLMRLVIVSGLATSTCSLLTLISYIVWPESLIFLGIVFILPKRRSFYLLIGIG
ncbi:uncharacterized protein ARMOST_20457 [Armillaria ostoyae]|uniref:DUF6534 domain-containing protein n=1 Tax=Armillaria ostoyae TaxID=47428 RepID=A0A284S7E2_ARMOS|nr:uncharacterized protein ARMOST_20457 [Armillaria ostoyae]